MFSIIQQMVYHILVTLAVFSIHEKCFPFLKTGNINWISATNERRCCMVDWIKSYCNAQELMVIYITKLCI